MRGPSLAVDIVIRSRGGVVLIRRKNEPFRSRWALPGGFVEYGETVEDAAAREALEETGIVVKVERLLGVYSAPDRDPRGHTISVCFLASRAGGRMRAASDATEVGLFRSIPREELAFDHAQILKDAGFK